MVEQYIGTMRYGELFRHVENGYLLLVEHYEVLLPFEDIDFHFSDDETIEVFIYKDQSENLLATAAKPSATKEKFGWATVTKAGVSQGVFVDIGIPTDILVPRDHLPALQSIWPCENDRLLVRLKTDEQQKLIAIPAKEKDIYKQRKIAKKNIMYKKVKGYIYKTDNEGSALYTDDGYQGFIHCTMQKEELRLGQYVIGTTIGIKDDGTINVSLLPEKHK